MTGTLNPRRTVGPVEDPLLLRIGRPSRTPEEMRAAILALLAAKPLIKRQIRELLHEPEPFLLRQLNWLRDDGKVRVVGRSVDRRAWALIDWVDSEGHHNPVLPSVDRPTIVRRAPPPRDSWWVAKSDAAFTEQQRARAREARWG